MPIKKILDLHNEALNTDVFKVITLQVRKGRCKHEGSIRSTIRDKGIA